MAFKDQISKGLPVKNSTGETIGVVDDVEGDSIKLTAKDSTDGRHHYVPLSDVARVDEHVHLSTSGLAPVGANHATTAGAAHATADHASGGLSKILPWLLVGLAALLAILWLSGSFDGRDDGDRGMTDTGGFSNEAESMAPVDGAVIVPGIGTLGTYLAGTEAAPRTFNFETLNFDNGKSAVRTADKAELDALAATLKQYGTSKVRVVGYADAQGAETANAALGKARADAVKAALVASGIPANRVETASGGEADPVDANTTAGGRFENRRTELVLTSR